MTHSTRCHTPRGRRLVAIATPIVLATCILALPSVAAGQTTRIVAKTGDTNPGGGTFTTFGGNFGRPPILNDLGQVAFEGAFSGGSGVYYGDGISPILEVVRTGDASPDGDGNIFQIANIGSFNNMGQVSFQGSYSSTNSGTDDPFLSVGNGSSVDLVARGGAAEPGGNGTYSNSFAFSDYGLNNQGDLVFISVLDNTTGGTADDIGFYLFNGTSTSMLTREGDSSPDGSGTSDFFTAPNHNDSGHIIFPVRINNGDHRNLLARYDDSSFSGIVGDGDAAPSGDGQFQLFFTADVNSQNDVAFTTIFSNTSGGGNNDRAIVFSSGNSLMELVREGDLTPGGNGAFAEFTFLPPSLNDHGLIAFAADLNGTTGGSSDNRGIFTVDSVTSIVRELLREGDASPDGNGFIGSVSDPLLNNAGDLAFVSTLTGTSGGFTDDRALFYFDDTAGLQLVIREGDEFLGSILTAFSFNESNFSNQEGFNNSGQLAYQFFLADGRQGIALWSPSTIPEPSGTIVAILAGWIFVSRRRRSVVR